MRIHRLISILLLIESRGTIKAKEIASKLEISVRTVYRDIDILCEAGIPLATASGPNGGIYLMDGYSVGIKHLQEEDIINLYLSGMGILPDRQSDMATKLNNTLLKLQKNLSSKQSSNLDDIRRKFYFDDTSWWGDNQHLDNIDTIIQGVFKSKILSISYQKYEGKLSVRRVHPYGIVVKRMDWYMIAYCEKNKNIRTFKCERIIECEILDDNFNMPKDFSIEEYWNKSQKIFKNLCAENENYPVIIKVHKNEVDALKDLEALEIKEDGNYLLATINMYGYEFAINTILKMIRDVEVIGPLELKVSIAKELDNIIKRYKK